MTSNLKQEAKHSRLETHDLVCFLSIWDATQLSFRETHREIHSQNAFWLLWSGRSGSLTSCVFSLKFFTKTWSSFSQRERESLLSRLLSWRRVSWLDFEMFHWTLPLLDWTRLQARVEEESTLVSLQITILMMIHRMKDTHTAYIAIFSRQDKNRVKIKLHRHWGDQVILSSC